jgi:hypothetical protein
VEQVLATGVAAVVPPTGEAPLIPSAPPTGHRHFDQMQQRVTLAPIWEGETVVGVMATVEDVTRERERERELACQLASTDVRARLRAAEVLAHDARLGADATLAAALGDDDWRVRRHAIEGLTRRNDCALLASVLTALRTRHTDLNVVSTALNVLTTQHRRDRPLIAFLDAPDRTFACRARWSSVPDKTHGRRHDARLDDRTQTCASVIEALGRLRARDAVEARQLSPNRGTSSSRFRARCLARIGFPHRLARAAARRRSPGAGGSGCARIRGRQASVRRSSGLGRATPADGIVRALRRFF